MVLTKHKRLSRIQVIRIISQILKRRKMIILLYLQAIPTKNIITIDRIFLWIRF